MYVPRHQRMLDQYLQEIGQIPLLTPAEETGLARCIKHGDQEALHKLTRAKLSQQRVRAPNVEELAKELDVDVEKVREAMQHTGRHLSMDGSLDEDDKSLLDVLLDETDRAPDEPLVEESVRIDVEHALSLLHPREAEITRLYFGIGREHPLTLEEIGQRFGLTRERVRQIKEKALGKLRKGACCAALLMHAQAASVGRRLHPAAPERGGLRSSSASRSRGRTP